MKPIYRPSGRALEYSPDALALNIYKGCPHGCYYCFAPKVLRRDKATFHSNVEPRAGIVEAVRRQLDKERITGKLIHLCFTCDPYPMGNDTAVTREIINTIKQSGNHVQILTKSGIGTDAERDLDLLDCNDWFGVTYTGEMCEAGQSKSEPGASWYNYRFELLREAKNRGVNTWLSCEPVLNTVGIYYAIELGVYIDLFRIGKMNHHPSDIDWAAFGRKCVELCEENGRNYYIKHDLREAMKG